MRILVAQIPMPQNRFLVDLNAELAKHCELVHSPDVFWNQEGEFDVIHLHFPEYLTKEIEEGYYQGELTQETVDEVEKRLVFWAARSRIIVTRHVLLPHWADQNPLWEQLYELVYRYADGVVHFAQASIDEFRKRYAETIWIRDQEPIHKAIPHQNYASLPNTISRSDARSRLGISQGARVMLVFGAIRNETERQLILNTFRGLKVRKKHLLVSRWRENIVNVSWIRLKYWIRDLKRWYFRVHPSFHFNYGFVEEEDTQLYLNAADVLFIPRFHVLNSGNVTLGMTFGRVVVGPDSWDVGELLREMGNSVFDPDRPQTAIAAVENAFQLATIGAVSSANRSKALNDWSANQCADQYLKLYHSVITQ